MLPVMNIAIRTLRQAGEYLQQNIERQEFLLEDADNLRDRINHIEKNLHKIVLQNLKRAYNDHYIADLGESGLEDKEVAWKFIPVHNPIALTRGLPGNAMSLVCLHKGKVEHAAILHPSTGDEYTASRGRGAAINDKRIRVGKITHLSNAMLASNILEAGRHKDNKHVYLDLHNELSSATLPLYSSGCSTLDLAYTAAGKLDAAILLNNDYDDLEAGIMIAKESGALTGDMFGENITSNSQSAVCANPKLFKSILQKLYTYRSRL